MPITPSYTWQESPTWVTIHVALRSIPMANIDIITTDCYIKVNCHPYLFQVDLFGDIESKKSSAVVENNVVRFFLVKKCERLWGRLQALGERKDIISKRENSLNLERERSNKIKAEAKSKAAQIGRLAVQSQMKLDEEKRKLVEHRKAEELRKEQNMIQHWQAALSSDSHISPKVLASKSLVLGSECPAANMGLDMMTAKNHYTDAHMSSFNPEPVVFADKRDKSSHAQNAINKIKEHSNISEISKPILPAPRRNVSVCVKFTPKLLSVNLPARESRDQVRLKEKKVTALDTVDISEREPLFLQDKGDDFYLKRNFSSAINAYTEAVQKDPSLYLCLANRAACFLQLQQFQSCIKDCTAALTLLQQKRKEFAEEHQVLSETSDLNWPSMLKCLKSSDETQVKSIIEDSLKLSQHFQHSKDKSIHSWYDLTQKRIFVRRAIALCNMKEAEESKRDSDEAFETILPVEIYEGTFGRIAKAALAFV